ncbi:MAG: PLP-dependent aminotransferase family protein [Clostridiales bacterium]|nr:PLP-dependent aminotransferase family protein [Candidatus Cacconaster stercorequi]
MLTYTLEKNRKDGLYEQLYRCIKADILSGTLRTGEKLPSKRMLAEHLEVSVVTVRNAYEQLMAEGYIYGVEKRGYFVSEVDRPLQAPAQSALPAAAQSEEPWLVDFAANSISEENFPFTVWSKMMRRTILEQDVGLLRPTPYNGALALRQAIADYLYQFRGLTVSPEQIIVGAGTEILYNLLVQLLGREKHYAVEDPGYRKIAKIYESNRVPLHHIMLDEAGMPADELRRQGVDVIHISPSHHYPTGMVMPIGRRQELLRWAGQQPGRYILEDDYDSEFRFVGRPIPTLFSIDKNERVIYLNTFSKTIAPSIRISYMILPPHLLEAYREHLGFYACTVSSFEQYTLAAFMEQGRYEQHINRMRNRYRQKRDAVIRMIRTGPLAHWAEIMEQDAGLHFLVKLNSSITDDELHRRASASGIRLMMLSDYYHDARESRRHILVVNYSGIALERLAEGFDRLATILEQEENGNV